MKVDFKSMTYEEFKKWCNDCACNGSWSLATAATCVAIIDEIDSIKIKGWFKRKATKEAREKAWKSYFEIKK